MIVLYIHLAVIAAVFGLRTDRRYEAFLYALMCVMNIAMIIFHMVH